MGVPVNVNGTRVDIGHLYPVTVRVPMTLYPRCKECGGGAVAELQVRAVSSAFRATHDHATSCSEVVCPHGRPWGDDCPECAAQCAPTPREVDQ